MIRSDMLEEFLIVEEDGGDGGDGGWGWGGDMYGYGGGDYGPGLYKTFVQPFTDVLKTTQAAIETAATKAQLLTNLATYAVMTSLLPFVRAKYDEMLAADKRRMQQIQRKYADVFKRTDDALTTIDGVYDGAGIFFVLFPHKIIAYNLTRDVAGVGADTAKTLVDGAFDFMDAVTGNATGVVTDPIRKKLGISEGHVRQLNEDDVSGGVALAVKAMSHPRVEHVLERSRYVQSMRSDALDALGKTLSDMIDTLDELKGVDTLDDVKRLGGNVGEVIDSVADDNANMSERDVDIAVRDALPAVVNRASDIFETRLERLASDMKKMGDQYGVTGNEVFKKVMSMFTDAERKLNALT